MIIRFNDFLLEKKMSFPTSIKPYSDLIISGCMERVDKYFKRKGKFANYTDRFDIEFDQISKVVNKDEFPKFPIESISVDFGIRVSKNYVRPDILGLYNPLEEDDIDIEAESFRMDSISGWVDEALHIEIKVQIWLPRDAKSYQLDRNIKYITSTIHHELIHSYEDFIHGLITGPFYLMVTDLKNYYNNNDVDDVDIYHLYLKHLLFNMYVIEKTEMSAYIGSAYEYLDDARHVVSNMLNFDAEQIYSRLMKDIETKYSPETGEKIMNLLNGVGNKLVEIYIEKCAISEEEPKKAILKLKNKNFKQLLEYFEPLYHKAAEYMTRKIVKMRYGKKQGEI